MVQDKQTTLTPKWAGLENDERREDVPTEPRAYGSLDGCVVADSVLITPSFAVVDSG